MAKRFEKKFFFPSKQFRIEQEATEKASLLIEKNFGIKYYYNPSNPKKVTTFKKISLLRTMLIVYPISIMISVFFSALLSEINYIIGNEPSIDFILANILSY